MYTWALYDFANTNRLAASKRRGAQHAQSYEYEEGGFAPRGIYTHSLLTYLCFNFECVGCFELRPKLFFECAYSLSIDTLKVFFLDIGRLCVRKQAITEFSFTAGEENSRIATAVSEGEMLSL